MLSEMLGEMCDCLTEALSTMRVELIGYRDLHCVSSFGCCCADPSLEYTVYARARDSFDLSTPIYKNGDRADKLNYRPISVLPVISRLFEKLVTNQLGLPAYGR